MSLVRPLDRYVFSEFLKIFLTTSLGFPFILTVFDLTDNIDKYLAQKIEPSALAMSYVYWLPDLLFMVLPAAVLFATVFTIGSLTRHSEITAAKASGISFYRLMAPLIAGAMLATAAGLALGEAAPRSNARRLELLEDRKFRAIQERYNFAYSSDAGRVYKVNALHVQANSIDGITIERRGRGRNYPSYIVDASNAMYKGNRWTLLSGTMHLLLDSTHNLTFKFDSLRQRHFTEKPQDLTLAPRAPADMGYAELGRFIRAMERSGADVNTLRVERMLKLAVPITSLVILLFGAPLATSNQRGGAAYGIGISLGTTVIFLMLIQMTKAIGGKGIIPADLAAWLPSLLFGTVGLVLLARVRT